MDIQSLALRGITRRAQPLLDRYDLNNAYESCTFVAMYASRDKIFLLLDYIVAQQRFTYDQSSSDTQPTWYIPLDYINKTRNDWSSPTKTWLYSKAEIVVHDVGAQDSWVVFNVNKTGWLHKCFSCEKKSIKIIIYKYILKYLFSLELRIPCLFFNYVRNFILNLFRDNNLIKNVSVIVKM